MYLSPLPGRNTPRRRPAFVLVRFSNISATASYQPRQFHPGNRRAKRSPSRPDANCERRPDGDFHNELGFRCRTKPATVSLAPGAPPAAGGPIAALPVPVRDLGSFSGRSVVPRRGRSVPAASPGKRRTVAWRVRHSTTASIGVAGIMPNGVSVPSDFPWINITTNNNPDPDPIFIDNRGGGGDPFNVIFDNCGSPLWYAQYARRTPRHESAAQRRHDDAGPRPRGEPLQRVQHPLPADHELLGGQRLRRG